MPLIRKTLRFFQARPLIADGLAVLAMAFFAASLWRLVHNQVSVLDEGLYLFKGWLYSSGRYTPFQANGPWTNQMPLAFLIPGWVELIFGPGIRTGRMFAVALGVLMAPGLWLTARRLGGRWVAAGVALALALNPAAARMFAEAASQGLVACILAWSLWFSLGDERRDWQLLCGGLLAGAAVMVRINLIPLLPLLGLYVLWARGLKAFWWSLGGMLLVFGGLHVYYWPNILQLWAKWLPFGFLKAWFPPKTIPTWQPDNPLGFRVASFFLAFRYHFAALTGALAALVFWPRKGSLKPGQFKIAVFLTCLLVAFFFLHAWAALGNEYCVFCFPTYTAFYAGVGLLLLAVSLPRWDLQPPAWRKWLGGLGFLALLAGMAYSAEGAAETMLGDLFYKHLLSLPLPGLRGALLWQVIANKFHLQYQALYDRVHTWFPVLVGVVGWLVILAAVWLLTRAAKKRGSAWLQPGLALGVVLALFVLAGSLLAAVPVLAGDYTSYDCPGDVITSYEAAGSQLAGAIPSGSKIFWAGYSPVSLLQIRGAQIYPPQLHGAYSFRISNDNDALLKYGWWNEQLAEKWLSEADFVLAEQRNLGKNDWLMSAGRLNNFNLVLQTAPQNCEESSAMLLYRRK